MHGDCCLLSQAQGNGMIPRSESRKETKISSSGDDDNLILKRPFVSLCPMAPTPSRRSSTPQLQKLTALRPSSSPGRSNSMGRRVRSSLTTDSPLGMSFWSRLIQSMCVSSKFIYHVKYPLMSHFFNCVKLTH